MKKKIRKNKEKIKYEEGCAIGGERIAYQCRKLVHQELVQGSSGHKAVQGKMERNAFCVIDRKFKHIPDSKK